VGTKAIGDSVRARRCGRTWETPGPAGHSSRATRARHRCGPSPYCEQNPTPSLTSSCFQGLATRPEHACSPKTNESVDDPHPMALMARRVKAPSPGPPPQSPELRQRHLRHPPESIQDDPPGPFVGTSGPLFAAPVRPAAATTSIGEQRGDHHNAGPASPV